MHLFDNNVSGSGIKLPEEPGLLYFIIFIKKLGKWETQRLQREGAKRHADFHRRGVSPVTPFGLWFPPQNMNLGRFMETLAEELAVKIYPLSIIHNINLSPLHRESLIFL
jgi:hypothetical protein